MAAQEDFSLLIPTYNREKYLSRILSYYAKHEYKCKIVIADSSFEENKILNQKVIESFAQLNIQYLSFHPEINPYQKLIDAINSISTKYCVMCADDDFITPKSVTKSIAFLETNPDFTAVGGYYYVFLTSKRGNKKKTFYWRKYLSSSEHKDINLTLASPKPGDRLSLHFANYFPTIYYIHRTDHLQMIYKEVIQNTTDVRFGELLLSMITLIHGKIQTLDILYGARESIIASSGATYSGFSHFKENNTYDEKLQKFRECLVKHLTEKQEISIQDAERIINDGMETYYQNRVAIKNKDRVKSIRGFIGKLKLKLSFLYINITQYGKFSSKKKQNLKKWNQNDPPKKYLEDFNDIKETVLEMQ
ncbi:MAG: TIGR00180 family glycosyltransferase [Candidatus Heimdallarchaeota archaeon]